MFTLRFYLRGHSSLRLSRGKAAKVSVRAALIRLARRLLYGSRLFLLLGAAFPSKIIKGVSPPPRKITFAVSHVASGRVERSSLSVGTRGMHIVYLPN